MMFRQTKRRNRIRFATWVFLMVLIGGVIGFVLIEGYSWESAFYMTIITVSTVGYGEVKPLTEMGRVFTSGLILTSMTTVAYVLSVLSQELIEEGAIPNFRKRKYLKRIAKMKNHIILVGAGRTGMEATQKLLHFKREIVVIEKAENQLQKLNQMNIRCVEGNATQDETLEKANIKDAREILITTPNDADNLFVVLSARQLNPKIKIISRASISSSISKLKLAGANHVIMPDVVGGDYMAALVATPNVIEFLNQLGTGVQDQVNLKEICVNDFPQKINKTIREIDLRQVSGCTVIGFKNKEGKYFVNPNPNLIMEPDSRLIILGDEGQIKKLNEHFS